MVLLKSQVKKRMSSLILAGTSINNISKELSLGKSTIYYYYKKLKGRKYSIPSYNIDFSEIEGEIVGIFTGDGSLYHHKESGHYELNVHFGKKNRGYALYVKNLYEGYFNKKFRLETSNPGSLRLKTYSKLLYHYFENHLEYVPQIKHCTVKLKKINFPWEFKLGFLRGLLDTDGTIYENTKRIRISYCSTSKILINQVSKILWEFEIQNSIYISNRIQRNDKTVYYASILKPSVDKFINLVQPFKARTCKGPVAKSGIALPWLGRSKDP